MSRWLGVTGGVVVAGLAACDDPVFGRNRAQDHVRLTITPDTIAVGEGARASAHMWRSDAAVVRSSRDFVLYSSGNPTVAAVDPTTGAIVGVAPGRTEIAATWDTRRAARTITVVPARD
jgi:hypothetical protein